MTFYVKVFYSSIAMSVSKKVTVLNKDGIHARPSALIVESARGFECTINFYKNGQCGNAANMLDLMVLAMAYGEEVEIVCDGENENQALEKMCELFSTEFNFKRE